MKFYSNIKERPIRLCEQTRAFAYESLNHKYGIDTRKVPHVTLTHIAGYETMSAMEQYDHAMREIVLGAPVRICDGELISGAATLGDAVSHQFPAVYYGDENKDWFTGVSHLTADFFTVLKIGMNGIEERIKASLAVHTEPEKQAFLHSCLCAVECMRIWHKRYLDALEQKGGYEQNIKNLRHVPFEPAASFYEAVQSVWFCFAFLRLFGCWPGIGRIDVMLGPYLEKDLQSGKLTLDEAREILAHFFIKGCEWIEGVQWAGGDAQHYQNLVLSGVDENGNDVTNAVTYLVLDVIEETGISDFPTTVRINKNTDEKLLRRVAEVISFGGGTVAIYNEDLVLASLQDMGYPLKEARMFANDGCWEVQIPGKTNFSYIPFDALRILQHHTLNDYDEKVSFRSFEELYNAYKKDLKAEVDGIFRNILRNEYETDHKTNKKQYACTPVSLFEEDCIGRGMSYREGGAVYTVRSPHIGGLPDVVNSLYALKKAVFEDKLVGFPEMMRILKDNWEGHELLQKQIRNRYTYYGNNNDEVDGIASDLLNSFADDCLAHDKEGPFRFVGGVSTFGRQVEWAPGRMAAPFGTGKGAVLAGNCSPTPGTDLHGATAIVQSYCKANLRKQHTGAALDINFTPQNIEGENAIIAIEGLIRSFCDLGGFFMQINTIDRATLEEAQKNPQNYQNLSVRVSGWSARFVTLAEEWQNMIIDRS